MLVLVVLLTPAAAHANGLSGPWNLGFDSEQSITGAGIGSTQIGEPLTADGAGTCADGSWQLDNSSWFAFTGTGVPTVVAVNGLGSWGLALYATNGALPGLSDMELCTTRERLELQPAVGVRYFVQVGRFPPVYGSTDGIISVARLATNDKREDALPLSYDVPVRIENFGATLDPGELSNCTIGQGWLAPGLRSVWAYVDAPAPGTLLLDLENTLSRSLGNLAVYDANDSTPIGCSSHAIPPYQLGTQLEVPVHSGRYWVQLLYDNFFPSSVSESWWTLDAKFTPNLDVDADGYPKAIDCNDDDPTIHPGAFDIPEDGIDQNCDGHDAVNFDRDGDTYQRPADCNDGNAAIHPEAIEIPDDGIDQNCDGHDDHRDSDADGIPDYRDHCPRDPSGGIDANHDGCRDPIQLVVTAQVSLSLTGRALHLESLTVRSARGVHIAVTCSRRACRREAVRLARSYASMGGRFAASVPEGAVVTISATEPGTLGMVKQYRLSAHGVRLVHQWCTAVGAHPKRIRCA